MEVELYKFLKAPNSTLRPNDELLPGEPGPKLRGTMREPFSILSPSIGFEFPALENPSRYNYAYVPDLNRYYFINDWVYSKRLWYANMGVDVLASWRDEINQHRLYVYRSERILNGNVIDSQYPLTTRDYTVVVGTQDYDWSANYSNGSYVVGIINGDTAAVGSVSYYVFTNQQFRQLCNKLLQSPDYLGIDNEDLLDGIQQILFNPFQYIASVTWFPFEVAHGAALTQVEYGWFLFDCECYRLASWGYSTDDFTFTLQKHPDRVDTPYDRPYLQSQPFTDMTIFFPGFGDFSVPPELFDMSETLRLNIVTDSVTGRSVLRVIRDDGFEVCFREGQVGVPVQISAMQMGNDAKMLAMGGTLALAGSNIPIVGGLLETAGVVASGAANVMSTVSNTGQNGFTTIYNYPPKITYVFKFTVERSAGTFGHATMRTANMYNCEGFVKADPTPFECSGTLAECEMIKNHIRNGFYNGILSGSIITGGPV